MSWFRKNIWGDAVFSKVIAQIIIYTCGPIAIAIWIWFTALIGNISFGSAFKHFFYYDFHLNVLSIVLFVVGSIILSIIIAKIIKYKRTRSFRSFTQANFYDAIIKWKWEKKKGKWQIKYGDYEKVCPRCHNNLKFEYNRGYYFLKCLNCSFVSKPHFYETPSGAVIMLDLDTFHFHQKLESLVQAEIRKRGLKM